MSRRFSGFADLLSNRIPIIRLGQSNIASRYQVATGNWGTLQLGQQDAIHVYHTYSHSLILPPQTSERATWERIAPHPVGTPEAGDAMGHWGLDLASGLSALGLRVAVLDWCIGGTSLHYWDPTKGVLSEYPTFSAWIQTRLAELTAPQQPIVLFDQGESGIGQCASWAIGTSNLMSALRADLGSPTMGLVLQQVPENSASYDVGIAASKVTYVAGDARSRLAYVTTQTFVGDNVHIDAAGGRRLAIGPDSAGCVSYLTGIKSLLGIT